MNSVLSFLQKALFFQVSPLIKKGRTTYLREADMPPNPPALDDERIHERFRTIDPRNATALLNRFVKVLGARAYFIVGITLAIMSFQLLPPIFLHKLVLAVEDPGNTSLLQFIGYALGLVGGSLAFAIGVQHYFYQTILTTQIGMQGINRLIFEKTLKLSRVARMRHSVGDAINLIGVDTDAVAQYYFILMEVLYTISLIICSFVLLYHYLGTAALVALATMLCLSPLTNYLGNRFMLMDEDLMKQRDRRVSLIAQVVSSIKLIKYFSWEKLVYHEVSHERAAELNFRKRLIIAESMSLLLYISSTTMLSVVAFSSYIAFGHTLDAATVFSCLAIFTALERPFGNLSEMLSQYAAARVSADRIVRFLREEELPQREPVVQGPGYEIKLSHVSVRYGRDPKPALNDVSLAVADGECVAIVGSVGGGKSTLLQVILGEVPKTGQARLFTPDGKNPRIAYVSQVPYVINASLGENILLSEERDCREALHITGLDVDFAERGLSLKTEIGEDGINLSGGQKQRVSLARAFMQDPSIILLDDPFSAVDPNTVQQISDRLLFGAWHGRTRVVVTHRLEGLERYDRIVFMHDGKIVAAGTLDEMMANPDFVLFYAHQQAELLDQTEPRPVGTGVVDTIQNRLIVDEDRETGRLKPHIYAAYLRAMGGRTTARVLIGLCLVASTTAVTLLPVSQNWWLSHWTNTDAKGMPSTLHAWFDSLPQGPAWNMGVYAGLGLLLLATFFGQRMLWALRSLIAGKILHEDAFRAILKTRVRFFDTNPSGRILNRFSQDVDAVEQKLPWAFDQMVQSGMTVMVALIVLTVVFPQMLIAIPPILGLYYLLQRDFRSSGRETKRLSSISKSPRFVHFKQTYEGLPIIRAFGNAAFFRREFLGSLEVWQRNYNGMVLCNRWFSIRIPLLSSLVSLGVTICLIVEARQGLIEPGTGGMVLMYATYLWTSLNWFIRSFSEAEAKLVSVERLSHFGNLVSEEARGTKTNPPKSWPSEGDIVFKQVFARYDEDLPNVLKGINLHIRGRSTTGIVGRTGAGKSSIFQVLYRFLDITGGTVTIDGMDITQIPLDRLRRSIAIIPQDPFLFAGTLRDNLDRGHTLTDDGIWDALERVFMRTHVEAMGGLAAEVRAGGENMSQGQKQLLCLARAILFNTRIIVMDEATANVDLATDRLIHEAIQQQCADRTVLIIAHRPRTIAHCETIYELSDGVVLGGALTWHARDAKIGA